MPFSCPGMAGSSPLARGTVRQAVEHLIGKRFIPARAGNGVGSGRHRHQEPVHPRSRGERNPDLIAVNLNHGSSPLARGTAQPELGHRRAHRFIPARAGNGFTRRGKDGKFLVHPRSRGERSERELMLIWPDGSSPLARGTDCTVHARHVVRRFIPARAGNGRSACSLPLPRPVHPRSRGERVLGAAALPAAAGSSPLARGTGQAVNAADALDRFIPARAGNGAGFLILGVVMSVHPRSRGERRGDERHVL